MTFSSLLVVTFIGVRMACRIGYRTTSTLMGIAVMESESNGPNLLDEPLKGFIVNPACSPWKCFDCYKPRHMVITTQWKCTTSAECKTGISAVLTVTSGLGPLWNRWSLIIIHLCYSLFMFTLIMCFPLGFKQLVATLMLKLWQLKVECY